MNQSLFTEALNAGRGLVGLLLGRPTAAQRFNFTLAGLVGALFGMVLATGLFSYIPTWMGAGEGAGKSAIYNLISFAAQTGFAFIALRQFQREDGLVPYVVCSGWSGAYQLFLWFLLTLLGADPIFTLFLVLIASIIVQINVGRLVLTLTGTQVVVLLIAQLVGAFIVGVLVSNLDPEMRAAQQALVETMQDPAL